jgi:hypothetical protein
MMNRRNKRGVAVVEFSFMLLTLVPLMLGISVIGIDMIRMLETGHLARDAGYLFASGLDVSQPGNQTLLSNIGSPLGLTTSGGGSAELIFSALTYVDTAACADAGAVNGSGDPSGCTNYGQWVFAQRLIVGNSSLMNSSIGSPLTSGPTGVTINSNGTIALSQYVLLAGAVATFSSINPYSDVNGNVSGLPSGQYIYVAEAVSSAFTLPPFITTPTIYAYGMF